jgi:hypothetical protein
MSASATIQRFFPTTLQEDLRRHKKRIWKIPGVFSSEQEAQIRGLWAAKFYLDRWSVSKLWLLRPFRRPLTWATARVMDRWLDLRIVRWKSFQINKPAETPQYDLVFFIPEKARGWILEGICKDIAKEFRGTWKMHYDHSNIPRSKGYFVSHYSHFQQLVQQSPHVVDGKVLVCFTHPRTDTSLPVRDYAKLLNGASERRRLHSLSEFMDHETSCRLWD